MAFRLRRYLVVIINDNLAAFSESLIGRESRDARNQGFAEGQRIAKVCRLRASDVGERREFALHSLCFREILQREIATMLFRVATRAENNTRRDRRGARGCWLARGAHEFDLMTNSAKLTTRAHDANGHRCFDNPIASVERTHFLSDHLASNRNPSNSERFFTYESLKDEGSTCDLQDCAFF